MVSVLLSAARIMVLKVNLCLVSFLPESFILLCQPLPPQKAAAGHLMLVASGEGCGRLESKWPGCFCCFSLVQRTMPLGRMSDEAGFLYPSLPPHLGKVFPGVKKGVKTVGK